MLEVTGRGGDWGSWSGEAGICQGLLVVGGCVEVAEGSKLGVHAPQALDIDFVGNSVLEQLDRSTLTVGQHPVDGGDEGCAINGCQRVMVVAVTGDCQIRGSEPRYDFGDQRGLQEWGVAGCGKCRIGVGGEGTQTGMQTRQWAGVDVGVVGEQDSRGKRRGRLVGRCDHDDR